MQLETVCSSSKQRPLEGNFQSNRRTCRRCGQGTKRPHLLKVCMTASFALRPKNILVCVAEIGVFLGESKEFGHLSRSKELYFGTRICLALFSFVYWLTKKESVLIGQKWLKEMVYFFLHIVTVLWKPCVSKMGLKQTQDKPREKSAHPTWCLQSESLRLMCYELWDNAITKNKPVTYRNMFSTHDKHLVLHSTYSLAAYIGVLALLDSIDLSTHTLCKDTYFGTESHYIIRQFWQLEKWLINKDTNVGESHSGVTQLF